MAKRHGINSQTFVEWWSRSSTINVCVRLKYTHLTVLSIAEEAIIAAFSKPTLRCCQDFRVPSGIMCKPECHYARGKEPSIPANLVLCNRALERCFLLGGAHTTNDVNPIFPQNWMLSLAFALRMCRVKAMICIASPAGRNEASPCSPSTASAPLISRPSAGPR